jgi:peptidoglycan/LPS O-acetylase OafA/YrhL
MLLATIGVAVVTQGIAFAKYGLSREWAANMAVAYHSLPARCFEFALGMSAAAVVARTQGRHVRAAVWCAGLLLVPALCFVLFISRFGPFCDTVWGLVFASAVILLSRLPEAHFTVPGPLRAMVWVGTISYSVYLIHQPLLVLLSPEQFGWHFNGRLSLVGFGLVRVAILVLMGFGFYLLLERPFILQRRGSRRYFPWLGRSRAAALAAPQSVVQQKL